MQHAALDDIAGGDAALNAKLIREVLSGKKSPRGEVPPQRRRRLSQAHRSCGQPIPLAAGSIDSGIAEELEGLAELSEAIA